MQIQPAAPRHFDALRRLLSAAGLPHDDLTSSHLEHFFVATEEDTVVGVVGTELFDDVGLLRSLAVTPSFRDDGLGTRLTDTIEQYAHRQGVTTLYLLTTTAADYFERRGYQRIERDALPQAIQATEEAARLCPSSATCMRTRIDAAAEEHSRRCGTRRSCNPHFVAVPMMCGVIGGTPMRYSSNVTAENPACCSWVPVSRSG